MNKTVGLLREVAEVAQITPVFSLPVFPTQRCINGVGYIAPRALVDHKNCIVEVEDGSDNNRIIKEAELIRGTIEKARTGGLTIGADPEYLLVSDDNRYYPACKFIEDNNRNKPCGLDGYEHVGELRPKHGNTPDELFDNIKACISELKHVPIRAKAGSGAYYGRPIGGHFHLGVLPLIAIIIALEQYVGQPLKRLSPRSSIGRFGRAFDVEVKPWGFEYRSLPSWICHPDLAYMVSVAVWCIANTVRNYPLFVPSLEGWERIVKENPKYEPVLREYYKEVVLGQWTKYETDDLVAAWGV